MQHRTKKTRNSKVTGPENNNNENNVIGEFPLDGGNITYLDALLRGR